MRLSLVVFLLSTLSYHSAWAHPDSVVTHPNHPLACPSPTNILRPHDSTLIRHTAFSWTEASQILADSLLHDISQLSHAVLDFGTTPTSGIFLEVQDVRGTSTWGIIGSPGRDDYSGCSCRVIAYPLGWTDGYFVCACGQGHLPRQMDAKKPNLTPIRDSNGLRVNTFH